MADKIVNASIIFAFGFLVGMLTSETRALYSESSMRALCDTDLDCAIKFPETNGDPE